MDEREIRPRCVHRGPEAAAVQCPSCRGTVRVKVFQCKMYGLCTIVKASKYMHCSAPCPDRLEEQNGSQGP